jgi:Calx-beta domain
MIPPRCTFLAVAAAGLVGAIAATAAAGPLAWSAAPGKPVIGPPTAARAKPQAAKPFTVSFKVTSSTTHKALTSGLMVSTTSAGGKAIAHKQSFRGGIARVSMVVPAIANGKPLRITVTIRSGGQSATKAVVYPVQALPKPSASVNGASAAEGNGSTTRSFPVTLSASTPLPVSISYATSDGTATAPADYASANGTVTFAPGETSKTVNVTVVGETAYEPTRRSPSHSRTRSTHRSAPAPRRARSRTTTRSRSPATTQARTRRTRRGTSTSRPTVEGWLT